MPFSRNPDIIWADGPAGMPNEPFKPDVRVVMKEVGAAIDAYSSGAGSIAKQTLAQLNADLAQAADTTAWVFSDPTTANNGIYRKNGTAGSGSWTRILDLPFNFIVASDVGAGTPNSLQATSSMPIGNAALVWVQIAETNTGTPVTIQFNGGIPLTIKNNTGSDVSVGGLRAGMVVMGTVAGTTFRLLSDQESSSIIAQAQAAALQAQEAATSVNIKNVPTVAAAKALDTTVTTLAFLKSRGRLYQWQEGDYAANVAADPTQAIFIKADAVSASAGAWVLADYDEVDAALCGARYGSGLDDRAAIQAARELAYFLNIPAAINGDVFINSGGANACSELVIERSATLIIRGKVKVGAGIPFDGVNQYRVFRYTAGTSLASNTVGAIIGPGTIDMSSAPGTALPGVDAISMAGKFEQVVEDLTIDHGTTVPSGDNLGWGTGGDSGIFLKDYLRCRVRNCRLIGCPDLGLYLSGDNTGIAALNADISGNYFYRNGGGAIAGKRSSVRHFIQRNTILECMNGIFGGAADGVDGNQGREWTITINDIRLTQGDPIRLEGDIGSSVETNTIVDFRCRVSDGTPLTVSTGNWGAGVKMNGCINSLVFGNKIRFEAWTAPSTANREAYGVALDDLTVGGVTTKSRRVKVIANDFRGPYGGVIFDGAEYCTGRDNDMENITNTGFRYREINVLDQNMIWDDYDFSATVQISGGTNRTYDVQLGKGRREGRDFAFNIYLDLATYTSGAGAATISGLPFANDNTANTRSAVALAVEGVTLAAGNIPMGYIAQGASEVTLVYLNASTATAIPASAITSNARVSASGRYRMR